MKINIIAACDINSTIGVNGKIPWYIPEDLKRFKSLTMGHAVIMGRKTWRSIDNKVLPGRLNIVVTQNKSKLVVTEDGVLLSNSLDHALSTFRETDCEQAFIIGGEQLYREALPLADRVYLTLVNQETPIEDGDEVARFPLDLIDDSFSLCPSSFKPVGKNYEFFDFEKKSIVAF